MLLQLTILTILVTTSRAVDIPNPSWIIFPIADPLGLDTHTLPQVEDASVVIGKGIGTYRFCGNNYKRMMINLNGYVAFGNFSRTPPRSPVQNTRYQNDMIAVFWSEVHPSGFWGEAGEAHDAVFYRHSTLCTDRSLFSDIIKFRFGYAWEPEHIVIVTWVGVHGTMVACPESGCNLNSHQMALGTKRYINEMGHKTVETYVIMDYDSVMWTQPGMVMAGLNQKKNGDRYMFYESFTDNINSIVEFGNSEHGPFSFRLDPRGEPGTDSFCYFDPDDTESGYEWDFAP